MSAPRKNKPLGTDRAGKRSKQVIARSVREPVVLTVGHVAKKLRKATRQTDS
jgi:hypothetical protein